MGIKSQSLVGNKTRATLGQGLVRFPNSLGCVHKRVREPDQVGMATTEGVLHWNFAIIIITISNCKGPLMACCNQWLVCKSPCDISVMHWLAQNQNYENGFSQTIYLCSVAICGTLAGRMETRSSDGLCVQFWHQPRQFFFWTIYVSQMISQLM